MKLMSIFLDKKKQGGFSLLELLIVMGLIVILAAVAVPMFLTNIPKYRLRGAARMVISDFQRARMEAVKRNCRVNIVLSPNTSSYNDNGGAGSYKIVETTGNTPLLKRTMPQYVTFFSSNFSTTPYYTSQGLAPVSGSLFLVNNQKTGYCLLLTAAGHMEIKSMKQPVTFAAGLPQSW